jgi:thymidylate synthase
MNSFDIQYAELTRNIMTHGVLRQNRTGEPTWAIPSAMLAIDLADGFPLLTLRRLSMKNIAVELEGFIGGITDKRWYQERGCTIWDEWCNPSKVPYGHDEETKAKMKAEPDLGPIYGYQWRRFGFPYGLEAAARGYHDCGPISQKLSPIPEPADQLNAIVRSLKENPNNRRMVCSAWNPLQFHQMALPPCHVEWQVLVIDGKLHLNWTQRSCDLMLGIPYNMASYALLAQLLAQTAELELGTVTGFLGDTHIYKNHEEGALELLKREPTIIPDVFSGRDSIFDWKHDHMEVSSYIAHPPIKFQIAV